jgi:hypothetical protein
MAAKRRSFRLRYAVLYPGANSRAELLPPPWAYALTLPQYFIFLLQLRVTHKGILITRVLTGERSTLWGNVNMSLPKIAARTNCLQYSQRIEHAVGLVRRASTL